MSDSEISLLVASSTLPALPSASVSGPFSQIDVPILPEVTDGSHFVTIPPETAGAFEWPYYEKPQIVIVNKCTAPITASLGIDEGACLAQVFRGDSSHYLLLPAGPGSYPGGGSGEFVLTLCDAQFKKHFPNDFS